MKAATNRQTRGRGLSGAALEAAVFEIAVRVPEYVEWDPPLTLPQAAAILTSHRGRGRLYVYEPAAWPAVRAEAVAALGGRPTQRKLAERLHVSVRTLRNYDRRLAARAD